MISGMRTILPGLVALFLANASPALARTVPSPPVSPVGTAVATLDARPAAPEPESVSLERIKGLAKQALSDISVGANDYGKLHGFSADYTDATRGLLDTLIGEWAMGGQISAIVEDARTDRLVTIRDAMVTARQDNLDFVHDAQALSLELENTPDAISFRQQQILLYGHLRSGLDHDRKVFEHVLALTAPPATISSTAIKRL